MCALALRTDGCQAVFVAATTPTRPRRGGASPPDEANSMRRRPAIRDACTFCLERRNLRRTVSIAIVVGIILTLINQGSVITAGHATAATWVRCALNFVVPFLVSNAGLLSARR
jgi:hypothetical protein